MGLCRLSKSVSCLNSSQLTRVIEDGSYIDNLERIFKSDKFRLSLLEILKKERDFIRLNRDLDRLDFRERKNELNFEEKQFIQIALYAGTFILSNIFHRLNADKVKNLRWRLFNALDEIRKSYNEIYTLSDICFVLYDIIYDFKFSFREQIGGYDFSFIFKNNRISRCLIGSMMLVLPQNNTYQHVFKEIIRKKKIEGKISSIPRALCDVYNTSYKIRAGLEYFKREFSNIDNINTVNYKNFLDIFTTNNERNTLYFFESISKGFHRQKDKDFPNIILEKIGKAAEIRKEISDFSKNNLLAFRGRVIDGNEWSNKIYLISNKLLATLETINNSSDDQWKINVALFELAHWIDDVHNILNKYDIEDDWDKIESLIKEENSNVEWKSTFWMSTEEVFIDEQTEKKKEKFILLNIVKAMLGMMNTDGGVIIVGLVENPQSIKREDVKRHLLEKNSFTFFDINYEFEKKKKNIDIAKREIQDMLFNETLYTADKFNKLWSLEQIEIKNNYTVVNLCKINVSKSTNYIYSVKKENDILWITLIKRADGRTIKVDAREYLGSRNINLT